MTVGSLFSGIGGLDLGFEWAGFETKWFCEIESYPQQVLARHWPGVPIIPDVRDVTKESVCPVDCIIGGFPCQDISYAGKGAGIDYDLSDGTGTRSGLWWEYWRIIRDLRPRYVVAENVAALTNRGLDIVLGSLAEIGYDAEWQIVSAASVGAPHIRERIFIVAYASCVGLDGTSARNGEAKGRRGNQGVRRENRVVDKVGPTCRGASKASFWPASEWNVELATDACIAELGRTAYGLPAGMDVYGARMKGLGNAVVPQVAYLVAMAVMAHAAGR
jgi:DNA (cytosine-5)-methyltransferase 1